MANGDGEAHVRKSFRDILKSANRAMENRQQCETQWSRPWSTDSARSQHANSAVPPLSERAQHGTTTDPMREPF
uniref:Uncharacterized protein n=1 Tax=Globodera pallida TaxID=36090 RepID=A0A183BQ71_GLOPA